MVETMPMRNLSESHLFSELFYGKEETERIAAHLGLPADTKLKFELYASLPHVVDEAKEKPSFESSGKKFWINPKQQ
ncbi:MAG: hypothetical protein WB586_06940 [Chthoniobacterales bacterium]